MNSEQIAVILKSFDASDEVRVMQKGKFELVHLGGITIGRATYEPGWKWSEHVACYGIESSSAFVGLAFDRSSHL
jgi:hypothetical protein